MADDRRVELVAEPLAGVVPGRQKLDNTQHVIGQIHCFGTDHDIETGSDLRVPVEGVDHSGQECARLVVEHGGLPVVGVGTQVYRENEHVQEGAYVAHLKFDIAKLEKLNDTARFEQLPPDVFWRALGEPVDAHSIVEIGAGTGLFAAEFARLASAAIVHAADTEQTMVDWMTENRPEVAGGRIRPILSAETHVPLPDEIADVVYMINLHHELADPDATYADAFRLLGPDGRLLVVDWAPIDTPKGPPQAVRAAPETIRAQLLKAGFTGVRLLDDLPWHSMLTADKPGSAGAIPRPPGEAERAMELLVEARDAFVGAKMRTPFALLDRGTAEYVAAAFLARASSSMEAIALLTEHRLIAEALTIARSLVEDVCSLSYILSDPDELACMWCDFEAERVAKYYDDLAEAVPSQQVKTAARDVQRSMGQKPGANRANWWSGKAPHAMARASESAYPGTLRFYLLLYAALCDIAHFNAPALGMYLTPTPGGDEPTEDARHDTLMAVQTSLAVALELSQRIDDLLGLGIYLAVFPLAEEASALAVRSMDDPFADELFGWVTEQEAP